MENVSAIAERIFDDFAASLCDGFTEVQASESRAAFTKWIVAKLEQFDEDLYSLDEYVHEVVPGEIRYRFGRLGRDQRYEQVLTAYDQLRVALLSDASYERACEFVLGGGELATQKRSAERSLEELREIESRLSSLHPGVYAGLKRQISESKLDCMYIERGGGAASLRLGRLVDRQGRT